MHYIQIQSIYTLTHTHSLMYVYIHTHTLTHIIIIHTLCLAHAGDGGHDHTGDDGDGHGHGGHGDSGYAWHVHTLPVDQTLDPAVQCLSSWVGPHYDPFNALSVANYSASCTPSTPAM